MENIAKGIESVNIPVLSELETEQSMNVTDLKRH
jgi:hypothetical protein